MMGHEFSDVDGTGRAGEFVCFLDQRAGVQFLQFVDQRITDRLEIRPGGRYLDVGCGTGDDACGLASIVM